MPVSDLENDTCSIARTASLIGDRWTLVILRQAFAGIRRFDDLQRSLGVSPALLSNRLTLLVDAGLLAKRPYADVRRTRHEYALTERGMGAYTLLQAMRAWGDEHLAPDGPFMYYTHTGCGGHAEVTLACEDCGQELTARDITPLRGPGWPRDAAIDPRPGRPDVR
jgi:DNA-binding HxlR family transcriptional regulator